MNCSPAEFADKMQESGAKAIRLFPSSTGNPAVATLYAFAKWFYGEYLEEFQMRKIPVVLEFSPSRRDEPAWDKLYTVAKEFPDLPIILSDGFQRTTWNAYKSAACSTESPCPNLRSGRGTRSWNIWCKGRARALCGRLEIPCLFFGTMVGQVLFSRLPPEQKKN
jgi:hypothetical protein